MRMGMLLRESRRGEKEEGAQSDSKGFHRNFPRNAEIKTRGVT
jgi:hypothetical protein